MSKARVKPGYGATLERMRPKQSKQARPADDPKRAAEAPKAAARWPRKPRVVQLNAGRIEFSMPYQIGVALLLGLILVILVSFRLGQYLSPARQPGANEADQQKLRIDRDNPIGQAGMDVLPSYASTQNMFLNTQEVEPVESTGSNVIVLVEYGTLADLGPVQAHFAENGIETEIVMENGRYFLRTKNTYDNPATPGTDGYETLQKIIEVGAKYEGRAPAGYETFAPHFFKDAYGKKVK